MSKNVIFDEDVSFPTPYVESPNPHPHHKIICMMFPRNGFPLYHFTLLLLLYLQTQLLYPPCQYNPYFKHHFHSWNLLFILFHPLVNTLNMISLMIHLTNLFLPFQIILRCLPPLVTLLRLCKENHQV